MNYHDLLIDTDSALRVLGVVTITNVDKVYSTEHLEVGPYDFSDAVVFHDAPLYVQ
jgi:hypothetical protein